MTDVEKAEQELEKAAAALTEARVKLAAAVREKPSYNAPQYEEYRAEVMKPLVDVRNRAEAAHRVAQINLKDEKRKAAVAGTFQLGRDEYGVKTMTKLEDGKVLKAGDRVTVGKAKTVWDVTENMYSASGNVELHRQRPVGPPYNRSGVVYRMFHFNQLTVVKES